MSNLSSFSHQTVVILDFGGQTAMLIARRVREAHVFCEILPWHTPLADIKKRSPIGIIFSGGPAFVTDEGAPAVDPALYDLGVPILGICYGCQLLAHQLAGRVEVGTVREYGRTNLRLTPAGQGSALWKNIDGSSICWMSHTSYVAQLPAGFAAHATTDNCPSAAFGDDARRLYGVQFHPEVTHTACGRQLLHNFMYDICHATGDWDMSHVATEIIADLKAKIGDKPVLCALSGGVDSSVTATLVEKAVGDQLTCVFVDTGLLRSGEVSEVVDAFSASSRARLITADASDQFLSALAGVTDPEVKRKIIGELFIRTFEAEAKKIGHVNFFVQGTIYPDVIESGSPTSARIKSHHNVGGLPEVIDFDDIVEPLHSLFIDEVRALGLELGLPENLVYRQPFPGPGLAIRIIGDITRDKLDILRAADKIFRDEVAAAGLHRELSQYFAVLTNLRSVGVMGDERTYDYVLALRAVITTDFMTAQAAHLPYELLEKVAGRIVNEVKHINRIVYEVTSKPPSTIEWE